MRMTYMYNVYQWSEFRDGRPQQRAASATTSAGTPAHQLLLLPATLMAALQDCRVFTASFGTETNTFAPIPTNRQSFEECVYFPAGTHPEEPTLLSACFPVLRRRALEHGFALFEGLTTFCNPSNKINRDVYEEFRDVILAEVTAALPLDAVVLGLHGAAIAHGYDDLEGDLISRIRAIVGGSCLISAEIDPHSHLTQLRLESSDIIISYKEFPHGEKTSFLRHFLLKAEHFLGTKTGSGQIQGKLKKRTHFLIVDQTERVRAATLPPL
jgi:hypothetical protein